MHPLLTLTKKRKTDTLQEAKVIPNNFDAQLEFVLF